MHEVSRRPQSASASWRHRDAPSFDLCLNFRDCCRGSVTVLCDGTWVGKVVVLCSVMKVEMCLQKVQTCLYQPQVREQHCSCAQGSLLRKKKRRIWDTRASKAHRLAASAASAVTGGTCPARQGLPHAWKAVTAQSWWWRLLRGGVGTCQRQRPMSSRSITGDLHRRPLQRALAGSSQLQRLSHWATRWTAVSDIGLGLCCLSIYRLFFYRVCHV